MTSLLAISIGPVQDFIAAARKTRDLWFGSHMLSEVARAAAQSLAKGGAELIFPAPDQVTAKGAIANKLLAICDDPADSAQRAREAAQSHLRSYRDKMLEARRVRDAIDVDLMNRQIESFLEWAHAWVPYDEARYRECRTNVERLLAGRKALRNFEQPNGPAGRPKSSLDPSRDSVIRDLGSSDEAIRSWLRLKGAEQLDGISLIKRNAESARFVSLARVAVDPLVRALDHDHAPVLERLRQIASELSADGSDLVERFPATQGGGLAHYTAFPFDSQLFYEETALDPSLSAGERSAAAEFQKQLKQTKLATAPAYLAVLAADGDGVGRLIGSIESAARHRDLSAALAAFAAAAERIVREYHGAAVYAGGDDVLAFLPLDTALRCADTLRKEFNSSLAAFSSADLPVSLSVGVAIGHYAENLTEFVQWARNAERAAKEHRRSVGGRGVTKDALAVALHTRTGGATATTVVHGWEEDPVTALWETWVRWHVEDRIPDGAAYELRLLARELNAGASNINGFADVLAAECGRVAKRKRASEQVITELLTQVGAAGTTDPLGRLRSVTDGLIVARRLAPVARFSTASLGVAL
ncbi:MAG: type III-B CRISPR-associated protein Cas10/Cmr2 [Chloroflexota bacterium]